MKLLITGSKGMLGRALMRKASERNHSVTGVDIDELDITDREETLRFITSTAPEVLVNAAAYADVDGSESDRQGAFSVNADGVRNLAQGCKQSGTRLLHVSTDYVFDGTAGVPYRENAPTNPVSVYGQSKRAGEQALAGVFDDYLIVRTSWLYGPGGRNFVKSICSFAMERDELRIVEDQLGSPTYTVDLSEALLLLAGKGTTGIVHFANGGRCSWFGFAGEIVRRIGRAVRIVPIRTEELDRPAPRPAFSVLDTSRFVEVGGGSPRRWEDALAEYLREEGLLRVEP